MSDESDLVLTVRNPWAHAMFEPVAAKDIENRTWQTKYRGRIAIHVGLTVDDAGVDFLGRLTREQDTERGYIIGTVELTGCHPAGSEGCIAHGCIGNPWAFWRQVPDADAIRQQQPDIQHWTLEHPRRFVTPIKATGALTLWKAGPSLAHLITIAEVR